ncbi:MAG: L-threonine 3-dehydrogenase [Firmicutes bacterium]|nr:L-threonine 3-dehydrogenase [Bacillota bacterium]
MAGTMKALVKTGAGPGASLQQVPIPKPKPGEVLIKVTAAAICGTDVHIYGWDQWSAGRIKPPLIFGHEFCGEIVELGEGVKDVPMGKLVTVEGHFVCGKCYYCRTGQGHICQDVEIIGVDTDGCFAEYVVAPAENVWVLDEDVPVEVGAIHDPYGNAVHTTLIDEVVGNTVLVTGCGPIGVAAVAIAKKAGASRVYATDVNEYRLDLALKMGADKVFNVSEVNMVEALMEETEGAGVDVLLEMAGHPSAINDGFSVLRKGGWAALLGITPGKTVDIDLNDGIIFKGATVYGINGRKMYHTWYKMQALLRAGLDLTPMITHRFKFEEFEKAFELASSGKSGKIILYP